MHCIETIATAWGEDGRFEAVIGLCGWIKITRQNRIDWGIHGRKGAEESARINAKGAVRRQHKLTPWRHRKLTPWRAGGTDVENPLQRLFFLGSRKREGRADARAGGCIRDAAVARVGLGGEADCR